VKIYVASSWRCQFQPDVVKKLRALGHEVYDFRGPGTGWGEVEGEDGGIGQRLIQTGRIGLMMCLVTSKV
jgi:hypothetical protein